MKFRSLYDCYNARYPIPPNEYVTCFKGHQLGKGNILALQVNRGDKLIMKVCQLCPDFDDMNDNPPQLDKDIKIG